MPSVNLIAAWIGILAGFVAGAIQGLYFHDEKWLGGYASWPRRMTRLGHVSFFGIAIVNLAYAVTAGLLVPEVAGAWPSSLFVLAAVAMPLTCYLSAYKKPFRHFFPIPVISLLGGAGLVIARMAL